MAVSLLLVALCSSTASAQYFGRNKVQYKDFDFKVLETEHFDIYYYPSAREGIDIAARMAERWNARLEQLLRHELRGRQPLVLYASHPDFEQTNVIGGAIGESTGGVTESLRRRIILPLGGPLADTDHVIGHELVHAFQFDMTTRAGAAPGETGAHHLPLWFIEGMAEYLSIGPVDANTAMWLRDAVRREALPTIDELASPEYFPYRWGQAFWAYVAGKWGDDVVRRLLTNGGEQADYRLAIRRVLGLTTDELTEEWHDAIREAYEPVMASTTPPREVGRVLLEGGRGLGGDLNVGPALSPDGRRIAFLSERSLLSIDLYVADVETGDVTRRLTRTATDPHYSSLQFIYSAGAWAADSRRIAVGTVSRGSPALVVFDADTGDREAEYRIPELDEIFNPTWSPDGAAIAFTGMSRGLTDLYVYDLTSSTLRALTNDPYAELQPAWAPDGSRIAFATDRFSSQLDTVAIGPYRLALVDPHTGDIEPVGETAGGKSINPQWAMDSRSLYFLSDRTGVPNLYKTSLDGDVTQITNVSTGLSGITGTSPALSVASGTELAAFSVYEGGNHHVYTLDLTAPAAQRRESMTDIAAVGGAPRAATLPDVDRDPSDVARLLEDPVFGLPTPEAEATYEVSDYSSSLSLEAIGQPTLAVGADRYGAVIGGGIGFSFADMLGDQSLYTAVQFDSGLGGSFSFQNVGAQASYINRSKRWNWGLTGGQVPYLSGGFASGLDEINGVPSLVEQRVLFRQTQRSAAGLVAYPFSSALRVEFQGGISRVSFDQIVKTEAYSLRTGQRILDETVTTSVADPLTLGTSSAALVYDTSVFGATSPIQGQRYRLETAPAFGGINYTSVLADYRRYTMPWPFYTIAGRVMHYGRYGSGAEDERLFPLFIGYPSIVRGYDVYSFSNDECVADGISSCPAFDRLVGSRMAVANLEFRFPLLRPFGSQALYGPLPVEVALFADAGTAWNAGSSPSGFSSSRGAVASAGVALRVNLFGFAVGEFDISRPFQRPARGWVFQFHLNPGF